jgi:hypothetical protein
LSIDLKHLVQIDGLRQKALPVGDIKRVSHKFGDLKEPDPAIEKSRDSDLIGRIQDGRRGSTPA